MKLDKLKVYILELLLIAILFFALFVPSIFTRSIVSILIFIYMFVVLYFLKNKNIESFHMKQVTVFMSIFAITYVVIFYALGLYFGFTKSKIMLSWWSIYTFIIPIAIMIISSEIIRSRFLASKVYLRIKNLKINVSLILTYISMVLVDLLVCGKVLDLSSLDGTLTTIGLVLFSSLSCNLLYNYVSNRYGNKGIIIYRLITTLYIYLIPISPDIFVFFQTFIKILYPYVIFVVLDKIFSKDKFVVSRNQRKKDVVGTSVLLVLAVSFMMLISCQFKYGILVISTGSMTGTIDKGDAIIYESYDDQLIEVGQIIVFEYNGIRTIHRVVDIKSVNGSLRFYTKGDANEKIDVGYITEDNIYGLVKLKVKYLGYPTLWVRSLFSE